MKTDLVLTMDEYLDECGVVPHKATPPAPDARHVPITANEDVDLDQEETATGATAGAISFQFVAIPNRKRFPEFL